MSVAVMSARVTGKMLVPELGGTWPSGPEDT